MQSVKDEVIVDLADRCRANQKKLMQMITTTTLVLLQFAFSIAYKSSCVNKYGRIVSSGGVSGLHFFLDLTLAAWQG